MINKTSHIGMSVHMQMSNDNEKKIGDAASKELCLLDITRSLFLDIDIQVSNDFINHQSKNVCDRTANITIFSINKDIACDNAVPTGHTRRLSALWCITSLVKINQLLSLPEIPCTIFILVLLAIM